jgi:hypothetical protein
MSGYQTPKLFDEAKYDGECSLCGKEIPKGAPLWLMNGKAYCMEHTKAEISTESGTNDPSPMKSAPISSGSVDSKFWMMQMENLCYQLKLISEAIKENTAIQERIWNERRP